MVYCTFVYHLLDAIIFVGNEKYVRLELNVKKLDVQKSIPALGSELKDKAVKEVVANFIHENLNFKLFECEAIKGIVNMGLLDPLDIMHQRIFLIQILDVQSHMTRKAQ
ncbi:hypothetical protein R1flu_005470 [Riccia fluitans]|uniref:Uncharacterized protein n=1 Tax=Riccia fluitans TaxID=41844 RepID=A0ABD1YT96_9MARC